MSASIQPPGKAWLPPASLAELEQYVQRAIGSVAGHLNQERAAVYSRVSSIDQHARSYSMEFQPDRSEEYAHSKGWLIAGLYADPDRTGRNSKRPGLQRMIRDIESGKITVVVVTHEDFLFKNVTHKVRLEDGRRVEGAPC